MGQSANHIAYCEFMFLGQFSDYQALRGTLVWQENGKSLRSWFTIVKIVSPAP